MRVIANRRKRAYAKKRIHRKTHGKIGFRDLAKIIAENWKTRDGKSRSIFDRLAHAENESWKCKMKVWKEKGRNENRNNERKNDAELLLQNSIQMDLAVSAISPPSIPPLHAPQSSTSTVEYLNNLIKIPSFPVARTTKEFVSEEIRFHEILCDQDLVQAQQNKNPATTVNAIIGTDCVA